MPDPKLDLTLAATLAGAEPEDVRVHEVRRPNSGEPTDAVYIDISRGAVALAITGPLRQLQLTVAEMAHGLLAIEDARHDEVDR
jgi:hypothetical protein